MPDYFSNNESNMTLEDVLGDFIDGGYTSVGDTFLSSNQEIFRLSEILADNSAAADSVNVLSAVDSFSLDGVMKAINAAGTFVENNKSLTNLVAGAIGGAYTAQEKRDALTQASQLDAEKRQRISDSIVGMKKVNTGRPGLLTRTSGNRVFNDQGKIV